MKLCPESSNDITLILWQNRVNLIERKVNNVLLWYYDNIRNYLKNNALFISTLTFSGKWFIFQRAFCRKLSFFSVFGNNLENKCRGINWCLYLRCWEAKPKLDYELLRWYPKAFDVMTKPIQVRNKGCTWQNSNKSPMKNTLQFLISTLMVLVW